MNTDLNSKTFLPIKSLLILLVGCLSLAGCQHQPTSSSEEKVASTLEEMKLQTGERVVRIRDYRVDSWRYIDPYNLIIKAGVKENYLVSLRTPCHELRGAFAIGFTSTAGSLDKFEDIVVNSPVGRTERCPIADIVKLEGIPK